jgi:hypothetical protein
VLTGTRALAIAAAMALLPPLARAQANEPHGALSDGSASSVAPSDDPGSPAASGKQETTPRSQATPRAAGSGAVPPGQWVYTEQYGWLWMPYSEAYTYAPAGAVDPYMYVYYPTVGWTWLVAPWVWGWGPSPFFGFYTPWRFAWFGHVGHFHPGFFRPFRGHGVRPVPPRGGFVRGGAVGIHRGGRR